MDMLIIALFWATAGASVATPPTSVCPDVREATTTVLRLEDLPPAVRTDLESFAPGMGTRDAQILRTDAPTSQETNLPVARFVHGVFVNDRWFVSFEHGQSGYTTIGYARDAAGPYRRWPLHYFGGPPCRAIRAALDGVITPGGFNF